MAGLILRDSNCIENEFLAEQTLVEVSPNFSHPTFHFISGDFGPFEVDVNIQIPLWFAISLQKQRKCKLLIPEWLSVEFLENKLREEKTAASLQDLDFHYIEIAQLIFENVEEEIEQSSLIKSLLQDLENVRMDRLKLGLSTLAEKIRSETINAIKLNNLSAMELHAVRRYFTDCMGMFRLISPNADGSDNFGMGAAQGSYYSGQNTNAADNTGYNNSGDAGSRKVPRFRA